MNSFYKVTLKETNKSELVFAMSAYQAKIILLCKLNMPIQASLLTAKKTKV
jgi:hypothetical protein